jgi:LacI family transcriptional regulator
MDLKTIAKLAGVSTSTVSRVISGKGGIRKEKTDKILRIAQEIGYRKNFVAHSMKTGKTLTIGVLISDISFPFYPAIVKGIENTLENNDYSMLLANSQEDSEREAKNLHNFLERKVEGIIISPIQDSVNEDYFWELKKKSVPFVVIDRKYDYIQCDFIGVDDKHGAYLAVKHLIELGHKKIGIITGPLDTYTGRQRLEGFKDALVENGIMLKKEYIEQGSYKGDQKEIGKQKVLYLLSQEPGITAIFCSTDYFAIGALAALKQLGKKVPQDVSVIGFAGFEETQYTQPALTTVSQPGYEIGQTAAMRILQIIKENNQNINNEDKKTKSILLKTKLIIRESTSYAPKKIGERR